MYLYRNIHCRDFFLNTVNFYLNFYFIKSAYRSPRQHGGSPSSHRLHSRWIIWLGFQSSLRRIRTGILRKCRRRHPQLSTRRFRYWFYPNNKLFKYQLIESTLKLILKNRWNDETHLWAFVLANQINSEHLKKKKTLKEMARHLNSCNLLFNGACVCVNTRRVLNTPLGSYIDKISAEHSTVNHSHQTLQLALITRKEIHIQ